MAKELSKREQWRLLTVRLDTVEIAHEQLATQWLRYQHWIANMPGDPERGLTSGLNFTQNRRFEFAVAAAAGAVD